MDDEIQTKLTIFFVILGAFDRYQFLVNFDDVTRDLSEALPLVHKNSMKFLKHPPAPCGSSEHWKWVYDNYGDDRAIPDQDYYLVTKNNIDDLDMLLTKFDKPIVIKDCVMDLEGIKCRRYEPGKGSLLDLVKELKPQDSNHQNGVRYVSSFSRVKASIFY